MILGHITEAGAAYFHRNQLENSDFEFSDTGQYDADHESGWPNLSPK